MLKTLDNQGTYTEFNNFNEFVEYCVCQELTEGDFILVTLGANIPFFDEHIKEYKQEAAIEAAQQGR